MLGRLKIRKLEPSECEDLRKKSRGQASTPLWKERLDRVHTSNLGRYVRQQIEQKWLILQKSLTVPRPERLLEPTTPELVSTQCVGVCGTLGFVVVCNGDAIIVIGPSTIGCRFFSRTNPGSVCHELMGEHVFGVVLENVIWMLL